MQKIKSRTAVGIQLSEQELQVLLSLIEHEQMILDMLKPEDRKKPKFRDATEIISSLSTKLNVA